MKNAMTGAVAAVALAGWAVPSPASAAYVGVYGGPATLIPVIGGPDTYPVTHVNAAGLAVGIGFGQLGERANRWDATHAAVELGNLGTAPGGQARTFVTSVNAAGTAVGSADKYEGGAYKGSRAVRWGASGTTGTELGTLGTDAGGTTVADAAAVNSAGIVVGRLRKFDAGVYKGDRPVRWDASGTATELGNLGADANGVADGYAAAINGAGTAVGYVYKYGASRADQGMRPVRWDSTGTAATELGVVGTDAIGRRELGALTINGAGTAFGSVYKVGASDVLMGWRAVRWDAASTAAVELGNIGTDWTGGYTNTHVNAANEAGTAVGDADKYDASGNTLLGTRAVRWDASGAAAIQLGTLATATYGYTALDVNAAGAAVGYAFNLTPNSQPTPIYWGPDGSAIDLNTLIDPASGWKLIMAQSISDTNWIGGIGTFDPDGPGGQQAYARLFVVQVPEPTTLSLLGVCGIALLRARRRVEKSPRHR
jgi:hypothetical protein